MHKEFYLICILMWCPFILKLLRSRNIAVIKHAQTNQSLRTFWNPDFREQLFLHYSTNNNFFSSRLCIRRHIKKNPWTFLSINTHMSCVRRKMPEPLADIGENSLPNDIMKNCQPKAPMTQWPTEMILLLISKQINFQYSLTMDNCNEMQLKILW